MQTYTYQQGKNYDLRKINVPLTSFSLLRIQLLQELYVVTPWQIAYIQE